MDILDQKKHQWYTVKRNFLGKLKLEPIIYTQIIRAPTDGDLVFTNDGYLMRLDHPEPKLKAEHSGIRVRR